MTNSENHLDSVMVTLIFGKIFTNWYRACARARITVIAQELGSRSWCGAVVSLHLQVTNAPLRG